MDFGEAIRALKDGKRVARAGWNGRGMHLELVRPYMQPGDGGTGNKYFVKLDITDRVPSADIQRVLDQQDEAFGESRDRSELVVRFGDILYGQKTWEPRFPGDSTGSSLALLPWIGMKTADDCFVPWLASQTDMLSEDWEIVS